MMDSTARSQSCLIRRRLVVGASLAALAVSYAVARHRPVPESELQTTRFLNDVPDGVVVCLYPVMQAGNAVAPLVVAAGVGIYRRHWLWPAATATAGLTGWVSAKLIKEAVGRDRPLSYLPEIVVREGEGTGLGYVSGHATVAAATAVVVSEILPKPLRPVAVVVAGLTGIARIVYGVHLPADVVGGWAVGTLVGLVGVGAAKALAREHPG